MPNQACNNFEQLFLILCSTQVLQIALGLGFCFFTNRMITPEQLGSWSGILFFFNIYALLTDGGLEVAAFDQDDFLPTIFATRLLLCIAPLLISFVLVFAGGLNHYWFFFATFFFLDKISNLLKINLDKNFQQAWASSQELLSFTFSNLWIITANWFCNMPETLPTLRICEKLFLLLFLLKNNLSKIRIDFNIDALKKILKKFALPSFGGSLAGIIIYDFMPFFLGVTQGSHQAGIFAKAFSLATLPLLLTTVFNRITTPLYAKSAKDLESCKNIFLKSQICKAIILTPAILFLQTTSSFWLPRLLGTGWSGSEPIYNILCIYAVFRCHYDDLGALINVGLGKPEMMAKNQLIHAGLTLLILPIILYNNSLKLTTQLFTIFMIIACIRLWTKILAELAVSKNDLEAAAHEIFNRSKNFIQTNF